MGGDARIKDIIINKDGQATRTKDTDVGRLEEECNKSQDDNWG